MTTDAEDRSTWPRNGQVIRRDELLRLIEENGGSKGLDLRGAIFVGDGPANNMYENAIHLGPDDLAPLAQAYRERNGGSDPPWLVGKSGIRLEGALLQGADLAFANLRGADLSWSHLEHGILEHADLTGAHLMNARLEDGHLYNVTLREAELIGARLHGAYVAEARLDGAYLYCAELERLDMFRVDSMTGAWWQDSLLDHTRIRRQSLGRHIGDEMSAKERKAGTQEERAWKAYEYHEACEAYLLLKNNFNQIGRYEDASWAYVKEQQMEKMAYYWEWRQASWRLWHRYTSEPGDGECQSRHRAWGSFWRWLRNWAYELATGYGERPWNAVGVGFAVVVLFTIGFWGFDAIGSHGAWAFLDSFIYSLATFATFNLADTGPAGRGADVASSVEALLGIAVLALVVFTLGNRMSRG